MVIMLPPVLMWIGTAIFLLGCGYEIDRVS
jgi:hypothetical protein